MTDLYWFSNFWFLKSCFICYFILYIGIHSRQKNTYWLFYTLAISQIIFPYYVSFMYPCFLIGYLLRQKPLLILFIKTNVIYIWSAFLIMLYFWDKNIWVNSHDISLSVIHSGSLDLLYVLLCRFYRLIIGIFGALSFLSITINIPNEKLQGKYIPILCSWGTFTLEIYILQTVVLEKTLKHFLKFDLIDVQLFNFVISPVIALIILFICVALTSLLSKSECLMLLLFGKGIGSSHNCN